MANGNDRAMSSYDPRNWFSVSKLYEKPPETPPIQQKISVDPLPPLAPITGSPAKLPPAAHMSEEYLEVQKKYLQDEYGTFAVETPVEPEAFIPTPLQRTVDDEAGKKERDPMKLDHFIHRLQSLSRPIPLEYRKKLPYDLICQLAHALLDGTVFEITKGLQDIQKITEENLHLKRAKLINGHRTTKNEMLKRQQKEIANTQGRAHKKVLLDKQHADEKQKFAEQCEKELTSLDQKNVLELDRQAADQQATLQRAGLPLFFITNDSEDIKMQMYILCFVMKLSSE